MFNLNPFRKQHNTEQYTDTDKPHLKQVYEGYGSEGSYNIVGLMYALSNSEHESEPSMLSSYELLMSPIYPDVKSRIVGSKVSVLKGNKSLPDLILSHHTYRDKVTTYNFNTSDSSRDEEGCLTGITYHIIYLNGQFYRVKPVQENEPVLMYELFENQDSKTIPSNFIRQVVKNKIMNYDLFDPSSELTSMDTNLISVYSLLEVLVFNSVHMVTNTVTGGLNFKSYNKDTSSYRTHLEHLLHINYISNTLDLSKDLLDDLLTAQGYSIFNSLLNSTKLNQTKQEYNQLYSLVNEVNLGIDKITTKLYNSLINQEPISTETKNQIITALKHEVSKVCETMSDLDKVTNSVLPITQAKNLTTVTTDQEWKSFLQFLND